MSESFRVEHTVPLLRSFVFDVERRTIVGGDVTFERDVVTHQGAVAILTIDDEGRVGLIRQYRAAFDRYQWEIPAGTCDVANEDPLSTAQRELREEMGCQAQHWALLGRFAMSPGWTNQVMTIYEAHGLTQLDRLPEGPEETSSSVHWLTIAELRELLGGLDAVDATLAIALHRVFGTFFDRD